MPLSSPGDLPDPGIELTAPAMQQTLEMGDLPLGQGDPPGEGTGNPLQYSCLENPMDRGDWQATVHGVTRVGHDLANKPPQKDYPQFGSK